MNNGSPGCGNRSALMLLDSVGGRMRISSEYERMCSEEESLKMKSDSSSSLFSTLSLSSDFGETRGGVYKGFVKDRPEGAPVRSRGSVFSKSFTDGGEELIKDRPRDDGASPSVNIVGNDPLRTSGRGELG